MKSSLSVRFNARVAGFAAENWTPAPIRDAYAARLAQAGDPIKLRTFLFNSFVSLFIFPLAGFFFSLALRRGLGFAIGAFVVGAVVGAILPVLWVQDRSRRRKGEISRALPGTLDLVAIATQSGLVIDQAVARVAELVPGALGEEMRRTISSVSLGQPRDVAWEEMASRLQTPDVSRFCYSIVQSAQLGANVASTLADQASQLRSSYAQRIRQRSVKASVAMIFPVVFFVLPAIFLSVLGPAIIKVLAEGI